MILVSRARLACVVLLPLWLAVGVHAGSLKQSPRRPQPGRSAGLAYKAAARTAKSRAAVPPVFGQPYRNTTGHRVYFHYQVSGHEYGTIPAGGYSSQEAYLQDITEAAALGADGFSLDLPLLDPAILDELDRFFAAANQYNAAHPVPAGSVNPAFTLFITLDCSTPGIEAPQPLSYAFLRFALNPAYTRVKDAQGNLRPRFSTYAGAGGGWALVKHIWGQTLSLIRAGGVNPFFVPGFEETDPAGTARPASSAAWVRGLLVGLADGCWEFPSGNPPLHHDSNPNWTSDLPGAEAKSAAVKAAGLYREGSLKTGNWASGSDPRWYNDFSGGEGEAAAWVSLITVQKPSSIQIATWNDYDEGSWTTNADEGPGSPWPYLAHSSTPGFYPSRLGLQKVLGYYIQWYKTGQKPGIARDELAAMYRPQTGAASAHPTADPLGGIIYSADDAGGGPGMSHAPDVVYLDCWLTAPADVTLTQDNGYRRTRRVPAGHTNIRLPFVAGSVTLTVSRKGRTVLTLPGQAIVGTAAIANANYYTCTAHD